MALKQEKIYRQILYKALFYNVSRETHSERSKMSLYNNMLDSSAGRNYLPQIDRLSFCYHERSTIIQLLRKKTLRCHFSDMFLC